MADEQSSGVEVAHGYVGISPSVRGFAAKLLKEIRPEIEKVRKEIGKELGDGIQDGVEEGVEDGLKDAPRKSRTKGTKAGSEFGGAWAKTAKAKIDAASRSFGDIEIGVATTQADQEIRDLKARLKSLSDQRVGIDIDSAAALTEVNEIHRELERLGRENPNIDVRVDAAAAAAQLAAIQKLASSVDGDDVNIDVNVRGAAGAAAQLGGVGAASGIASLQMDKWRAMSAAAPSPMLAVAGAAVTLASALIPIGAAAGAAAAGLVAVTTAAGAGVGTLAASVIGNIKSVIDGQKDLKTAQDKAAQAATSYSSAQDGVRSALQGVKSAQSGVASAQIQADRAVKASMENLATARVNADRSIKDATSNLASVRTEADRAMQSARSSLSSTISSANSSIVSAENNLASAQDQARSAQEALNNAREDARQKLADYNAQLKGAALDESGAKLAVRQAQQALNEILADPKATQLQIDLAKQALKESRFNYTQTKKDRSDLRKQAAEDRKQGVKGDEAVKDAKDDLKDANKGVRDAEKDLADTRVQAQKDIADARKGVVQARVEGSKKIAEAEQQVKQARVDGAKAIKQAEQQVAQARADGARAVAQAQQGVISAQQQLASAQKAAAEASATYAGAQSNVRDAMAKLGGPAAKFVGALDRAKGAWNQFLDATRRPALGLAAAALGVFTDLMPKLAPLANTAAFAVGTLISEFGKWVNGPEAQGFIDFFSRTAGDAIVSFGRIVGNIMRGLGGFVIAFQPLGQTILDWLEEVTGRWANWSMDTSNFKPFFDYVERVGPKVLDFFAAFGTAIGHLIAAMAPIGEAVLVGLTKFFDLFNKIPTGVVTVLIGAFIGLSAAAGVLTIAIGAIATAMVLAQVGLAGVVLPVLAVGAAIGALVAGFILAYKHSSKFRTAVDAVVALAKVAARWIGQKLKAAFSLLMVAVRAGGQAIQWLWKKSRPVLLAIGKFVMKVVKTYVLTYFRLIKFVITKVLIPTLKFLWNKVVKPVFKKIGQFAKWLWERAIKPAFNGLKNFLQNVLFPVLRFLWNRVVKPVFEKIRSAISFAWHKVLKPIFGAIKKVLKGDLSGAFNDLKDVAANVFDKIWGVIKGLPGKIAGLAGKMFKAGKSLIGGLFDGLKKVGGGALGIAKSVANGIIGFINRMIDDLNDKLEFDFKVKGIGFTVDAPDVPNIPKFAKGGYVTSATLGMVGEGKEHEAILPRSVLTSLMQAAARAGVAAAGAIARTSAARPAKTDKSIERLSHKRKSAKFGIDFDDKGLKKANKQFHRTSKVIRDSFRKRIKPDLRSWQKQIDQDLTPTITRLQSKTVKRTFSRINSNFSGFRKGPLKNLTKDWDNRLRKQMPDDANTFSKKTRDAFARTRDGIRNTWSNGIKPILRSFGTYPKQTVAPLFRSGVDAIGKAWERVENKAKKPIKFVIQTVLNKGLRGAFNKIANYVDAKKMPSIPLPRGFKSGGPIPGSSPSSVSDNIPIWATANEFMVRQPSALKVERNHPGALDYINETGNLPGFARGGSIAGTTLAGASISQHSRAKYPWARWAGDLNFAGSSDYGNPVYAYKDGRISRAAMNGEDGSYGNVIEANHPKTNERTLYAHLSRILVKAGEVIKMGQMIGRVGSVGNSTGPHLHFELAGGTEPIVKGSGGSGPSLPGWAQKILDGPKKWAKGQLDGGKQLQGFGLGSLVQKSLSTLVKPVGDWAQQMLGSAGAGAFGPGAKGIWKSLLSTGFYSPQQAAGVMGNMVSESGLNPYIVQGGGTTRNPASIGPGVGYGLVQWTDASKLVDYLQGKPPTVQNQVNALTAQLQGKGPHAETTAGQMLKATRTVQAAATAFLRGYERPADQSDAVAAQRGAQAQGIFNKFKGTHDRGGWLNPNELGLNKRKTPEAVLTGPQWRTVERYLPSSAPANAGRTGSGGEYVIVRGSIDGLDVEMYAVAEQVVSENAYHDNRMQRMRNG